MFRTACVVFCLFFLAVSAGPQSPSEFAAKYPVVTSYEVRPGILMTPKYTDGGQVCEISFERQRATRSGNFLDSKMSDKLMESIEAELAPPAERGATVSAGGMVITTGVVQTQVFDYANLTIERDSGGINWRERVVIIRWKNRTCKSEPNPLPLEQYPH
jgi:hypothetical protein